MVQKTMKLRILLLAAVLLAGCASLPHTDLRGVPAGKALVYGSVVGLNEDRAYTIVLLRRGPGVEIVEPVKAGEWDQTTQKGFVWTLAPGEYELYRYLAEAPPSSGIRTSYGYWVSARGFAQSLDLGRKATEAEFRAFDHDSFRVEAGKLYYVGEWRLQPRFPIIRDNRARSDRLVAPQYPGLDLDQAVTLLPAITGDQDPPEPGQP